MIVTVAIDYLCLSKFIHLDYVISDCRGSVVLFEIPNLYEFTDVVIGR